MILPAAGINTFKTAINDIVNWCNNVMHLRQYCIGTSITTEKQT